MQAIVNKIVKIIDSPVWRYWWLGWYAGMISAIVVVVMIGGFK